MNYHIAGIIHRAYFFVEAITVVLQSRPSPLTMVTLEMETCVRGFHAFKATWKAAVGEEIVRRRERGNQVDCYVVAVAKDKVVVSHVPQKISQMCLLL